MATASRTVVLVEGVSDQLAVERLARRAGRDLAAEGVTIVPMGGATNVAAFVNRFSSEGDGVRLTGLCDVGEEPYFRRALERAGFGSDLTREALEALGFFVCVQDLEDELIRALGGEAVEAIVEREGELERFRTFQKQPEWRARALDEQLRRFLGTFTGRKIRYAPLLVGALDLTKIPRPLAGLLASL
jgi:hypothetical protein